MTAGRNDEKPIFIGQLAGRAGVSTDTVRYYERLGLIPRPGRSASGYRIYRPADIDRLQFIQKAQHLGFSLEQIKNVLDLRGSGRLPCQQVIELAENRLAAIESELATLKTFQKTIRANLDRWKNQVDEDACTASQFCNLIEELDLPARAPNSSRPAGK